MERHYTKAQILEAYLNQIPFGHGWFGVDAAARHYFGKSAGELTLAEAATLAALPRSAPYYDPIRHPDRARKRRDLVLRLMADQGLITTDSGQRGATSANGDRAGRRQQSGGRISSMPCEPRRRERASRWRPVATACMRRSIRRCRRPPIQRWPTWRLRWSSVPDMAIPPWRHTPKARRTTSRGWSLRSTPRPATCGRWSVAGTTVIRRSTVHSSRYGSRGPRSNRSCTPRPSRTASPRTRQCPTPRSRFRSPTDPIYRPEDADGQFQGPMTVRDALARSRNSVAIQLAMQVGIDSVIELAHQLGITTPIAPFPSSAIGASGVRPIEMVAAYTAFATLGTVTAPQFISRIEDRGGHTVWTEHPAIAAAVLDSNVAFIVRDMMRDVIDRGTATARSRGRCRRRSPPPARQAPRTTIRMCGSSGVRPISSRVSGSASISPRRSRREPPEARWRRRYGPEWLPRRTAATSSRTGCRPPHSNRRTSTG